MALAQVIIEASAIQTERIGHQAVSLTHPADLLECKIAMGSVIEIGGALFEAAADEAGTGWSGIANSSQVYMKLTVTGATAAMSFTITPPTWSTSKQGWYVSLDRYIGGLYKDSGGNYTSKWLYRQGSGGIQNSKEYGDGTISFFPITNANLGAAAVSSDKIAWTFATGNQYLTGVAPDYVLPAGLYAIYATGSNIAIEVFINGGWRQIGAGLSPYGMMVFSDGTNTRLHGSGNFTGTAYWIRLA